MTTNRIYDQYTRREYTIAGAIYGAIVMIVAVAGAIGLSSLVDAYGSASVSADILARIEGRVPGPPPTNMPAGWPPNAPAGSAFLEGDTMTVAGAALLQRVTSAISRVGGIVLSSQVELQASPSEAARIGLVVSGEMDQAAEQQFLYDIEGGMPFLFVEQLLIQAATGAEGGENGRARVTITVSSQWRRAR